ncbi:molybdenum cofactor cytidylyltransferase [Pricia antarctica]|uniref:Molybdenum cofactor cytidylyltransferase n=1 Tax=Pricia antarctica TaxID=641691 RepID=A0A1G7EY52_9FLAO|nr:nucleotidyltransferase family protein [Pricia antarctica]SDE68396.1 molybdenum cofactor cytidylyltransferase [Pricia antarctica]
MTFPKKIAIVILAAGASSRMGEAKQLLPWQDTTLLGNAIRNAKASHANSVTVVLGANAEAIRNEISESQIAIVENRGWASGLGSSIACGTIFLLRKKNKPKGILVMLADQPLIDPAYLNAMMAVFNPRQEMIIATAYEDRAGVPALFSKDYYKKLTNLDDDFGAKKIIDCDKKKVSILNFGKITVDIDTKSDYKKVNKDLS